MCAGVLNPEELAIVNSTFGKAEASSLPGIPEDTRKSTESTSTLDSDTSALEKIEVELFENVRASIQKSLGKDENASNVVDSCMTKEHGELSTPFLGCKIFPPVKSIKCSCLLMSSLVEWYFVLLCNTDLPFVSIG